MDIVVTDAVLIGIVDSNNVWFVGKEITYDDGKIVRQAHAFPEDYMENLVVEYDFDINDFDTLIEIILYEPLLDDAFDPSHPKSSHNATTVTEAREFLLSRVKKKRNGGKIKTRNRKSNEDSVARPVRDQSLIVDAAEDPELPLDVLKREILLDPDIIEFKKERVREQRALIRKNRKETHKPTIEELRRRPTADQLRVRHNKNIDKES